MRVMKGDTRSVDYISYRVSEGISVYLGFTAGLFAGCHEKLWASARFADLQASLDLARPSA